MAATIARLRLLAACVAYHAFVWGIIGLWLPGGVRNPLTWALLPLIGEWAYRNDGPDKP